MRGKIADARPCTLVTVVDREGNPGLYPIPLPRDGERDNDAWISARAIVRSSLEHWVRMIWKNRGYEEIQAQDGYAPDPDWSKLPPFHELVRKAFGENGIIDSEDHPIYRDLYGKAKKASSDGIDL
jgi:hypothetical protein